MKVLNQWFHRPLGQMVINGIQEQFDIADMRFYGECLQIGTSAKIIPKKTSVYSPHMLTPEIDCYDTDVVADLNALPFLDKSVAAVFLPFTLEYLKDITNMLDEIERILTADGHLFIVGINPWSLWGIAQMFHNKALFSKKCYLRSSLGIYSLLTSRGFYVHGIKSFFYRPPFSSGETLDTIKFLEPVGQMLWPYPGGLYLLFAQKWTPQFLSVAPLWKAGGYVFGKA